MNLPPSPDRSELFEGARAAAAEVAALPPVERALLHADQRASMARGLLSEECERATAHAAIDADPLSVLAAEVRRLRAERAREAELREQIAKLGREIVEVRASAKAFERERDALTAVLAPPGATKFHFGARVRKIRGAQWRGRVVGFYTTTLTPEGYAVESENEPGSVQIYPAEALEEAS